MFPALCGNLSTDCVLVVVVVPVIFCAVLNTKMGGKALLNTHPKKENGSKGARRCRVCGKLETAMIP